MCSGVKGDAHDGGFPSAVGAQQGTDLAAVEGDGQVSDSRPAGLVLLGHRHEGDARGASVQRSRPVLRRRP